MPTTKKVLRQHDLKRKKARRDAQAREGLHRWGYSATITHTDEVVVGKHMPGLCYGSYEEAVQVGDRLKTVFLDNNVLAKDDILSIEPIPYEKISVETQRQFEGLNDQATLVGKALYLLAAKYKDLIGMANEPIEGESGKSENQIVNDVLEEARKILFPRLEQATLKLSQVEGAVVAIAEEPVPVDSNEIGPDEASGPAVTELMGGPH